MPSSSDYTSVSGGLKLKGAKNAGVDKKKKSSSKKKTTTAAATPGSSGRDPDKDRDTTAADTGAVREEQIEDRAEGERAEDRVSRVQRALGEEDAEDAGLDRARSEDGVERVVGHKTEAERRYEEMRRKRVRGQYSYSILFLSYPNPVPLYTIPSNVLHPILSIPTI